MATVVRFPPLLNSPASIASANVLTSERVLAARAVTLFMFTATEVALLIALNSAAVLPVASPASAVIVIV